MSRSELSMLRCPLFFNVLRCAAGVAMAVGLVLPCIGQATVESMQVVPAVIQVDAPMQVIATTLDMNRMDFGDSITLMNTSDKLILSWRLGWIYRKANEDTSGTWAVGRPIELRLSPNSLATVGSQGIGFSAARDVFKKNGIAKGEIVVGVVEVRFQDGTQWSYPLGQKGRFDFHEDQQLRDRIRVLMEKEQQGKGTQAKGKTNTHSGNLCTANSNRQQPGFFASTLDSLRGGFHRALSTHSRAAMCAGFWSATRLRSIATTVEEVAAPPRHVWEGMTNVLWHAA